MAAGPTHVPIASQSPSGVGLVDFTSIPSTYTDLILVCKTIANGTANNYLYLQFNSDAGTNYSRQEMSANGTVVTAQRPPTENIAYLHSAALGTAIVVTEVQIFNYANATTRKSWISRGNDPTVAVSMTCGVWKSTAAVNAIRVAMAGSSPLFSAGTMITLYGIKCA